MWELSALASHSHPTVKLWAGQLVAGKLASYEGDPLLDFSMTNFLDRISYKNPKSKEKLTKMTQSTRMAQTELPVNQQIEEEGQTLIKQREEEKFFYKYFELRGEQPSKKKAKKADDAVDEEEEDPELEAFANEEIEKEMKRLNGGIAVDEDSDDVDGLEDEDDEDGEDVLEEGDIGVEQSEEGEADMSDDMS
jgi:ribosome biogenesis protein MAK21